MISISPGSSSTTRRPPRSFLEPAAGQERQGEPRSHRRHRRADDRRTGARGHRLRPGRRSRRCSKGPDTRPYVVGIGDKVYDGEVVAMDKNSVSFKKSLTVALAGQKDRVIIKTLNPEEEEMKKMKKATSRILLIAFHFICRPGARRQGDHQQNRIFPRRGFRAAAHADRQDPSHSRYLLSRRKTT